MNKDIIVTKGNQMSKFKDIIIDVEDRIADGESWNDIVSFVKQTLSIDTAAAESIVWDAMSFMDENLFSKRFAK